MNIHSRWNIYYNWICYVKSRWLDWLSAFLVGEICNYPPTISNYFLLQRFTMRGKRGTRLVVSLFYVRGPPVLFETEKNNQNQKGKKMKQRYFKYEVKITRSFVITIVSKEVSA